MIFNNSMLTWAHDIYITVIPYILWKLCIWHWALELLEDIALHEHDYWKLNQRDSLYECQIGKNIAYTRYALEGPSMEGCTKRKGMKWRRWTIACTAIKPLICIVSMTNTLHRISFLVIEFIVYLYMHYLLSRRAKGLRSQSFCK